MCRTDKFSVGPVNETSNPFGDTPDPGSYFTVSATLRTTSSASGAIAGWVDGVCNFVHQRSDQNVYTCTLTITYNDNLGNENPEITITGSYGAPAAGGAAAPFTRSITGGTGKFFGATGSMRSSDNGNGVFKHEIRMTTCNFLSR